MEKERPEEAYDPFERAIRKTGCWKEHLMCAECIGDTKDWRECNEELQKFRSCMQNYMQDKLESSQKASN
ncbi:unnamed protein product [Cercopithifilaria johnstoni]|uniref:Uncharacterized protein n=1 Tax=Cercopithifilaria johnstoni TaxID=2874296 RepID=A0A8J2PQZ1_9BILA|nr:unnamed protein product [Cercopithifilaria johnstoni]